MKVWTSELVLLHGETAEERPLHWCDRPDAPLPLVGLCGAVLEDRAQTTLGRDRCAECLSLLANPNRGGQT